MPYMLWELRNQSLLAVLYRLLAPTKFNVHVASLDMSTIGAIWLAASCALAAAMYGWFTAILRTDKRQQRDGAILAVLLIYMTICNPLGWKQNSIALIFPLYYVLDAMSRTLHHRRTLAALLIGCLYFVLLRGGAAEEMALFYKLQVYGGRFWSSILLAAGVVVAYYAVNHQAAVRIADSPDMNSNDMHSSDSAAAILPLEQKRAAA